MTDAQKLENAILGSIKINRKTLWIFNLKLIKLDANFINILFTD